MLVTVVVPGDDVVDDVGGAVVVVDFAVIRTRTLGGPHHCHSSASLAGGWVRILDSV